MPAVFAALVVALRYIIIWCVQYGLFTLIADYGLPLLNSAIAKVAESLGVSDEEATDIAANKYLEIAEQIGIGAALIKSRTPLKVADRLGFNGKGWNKRKLSTKAEAASNASTVAKVTTAELTVAEVDEVVTQVAKAKGVTFAQVKSVTGFVATIIGLPVGFFYAVAQYIDYAAWQNPYQKTFQKLLGVFGVDVDTHLTSARTVSADTWKKILAVVEVERPTGISMPFSGQTLPYSQANLAKAVDEIAANIEKEGGRATYRSVWAVLLPLISINGEKVATPSTSSSSSGGKVAISVPQVQVFTGVLSQGVLGNGLEFQSRPDDLIETAQEMADAAANNLAPWLATLAGRITYQVKVVPSITTKDGFVQRGSATQIISGYSTNGTPKYKTVINKFATLDISVTNDKGAHVKLATIVLGPVDSVKFQVQQNTLTSVEGAIRNVITTSDINSVKGISTVNPITITTPKSQIVPQDASANQLPVGTVVNTQGVPEAYKYYIGRYGSYEKILPSAIAGVPGFTEITEAEYNAGKGITSPISSSGSTASPANFTPAPAVSTPAPQTQTPATTAPPAQRAGANANTLAEWYAANGQSLPTIQARSVIYQNYGLGQASFYTGTAEQNAKLLSKLKA